MSELDEIRARWAGIGPWEVVEDGDSSHDTYVEEGYSIVRAEDAPKWDRDEHGSEEIAKVGWSVYRYHARYRDTPEEDDKANADRIARAPTDIGNLFREIERLRTALEQIVNPIGYLQAEAVKEGAKLDGAMAVLVESTASWYREHARKALLPDANRVGGMRKEEVRP